MKKSFDDARSEMERCADTVEQRAKQRLARHSHFHNRAGNFQYEHRNDTLTVRGCVPSFYLKQLLQTLLKGLDGVEQIDNQVDVVPNDVASSFRWRSSSTTGI